MRDTERPPKKLNLNPGRKRERQPMQLTTAIIFSATILAIAILLSSFVTTSESDLPRYQLVNVGNGDTHRIDRETGIVSLCFSAGCVPLETVSDEEIVWDEAE